MYALRVLHARTPRPRDLLLVSAALGALPWIHSRFLLFPPIFGAFLLSWRERRSPARLACLLGPAAVLVGGLVVYNALVWHTFGLAPNQVNAGAVPFTADPWRPLLGILLDQEVGVFPNFPVLLFVLPGLLLAWRTPLTLARGRGRGALRRGDHVVPGVGRRVVAARAVPGGGAADVRRARRAGVGPGGAAHARRSAGCSPPSGLGLTTLAVCSPTGGFTAQKGRSPALGVLDGLSGFDVARLRPVARAAGPGGAVRWPGVRSCSGSALLSVRGRRGPAMPAGPLPPRPGWSR